MNEAGVFILVSFLGRGGEGVLTLIHRQGLIILVMSGPGGIV